MFVKSREREREKGTSEQGRQCRAASSSYTSKVHKAVCLCMRECVCVCVCSCACVFVCVWVCHAIFRCILKDLAHFPRAPNCWTHKDRDIER